MKAAMSPHRYSMGHKFHEHAVAPGRAPDSLGRHDFVGTPRFPLRLGRAVRHRAATRLAGYRHALRRRLPDAEILRRALRDDRELSSVLEAFGGRDGSRFFFDQDDAAAIVSHLIRAVPD